MLTITDMTGSIDSPFGALAFTYDSASASLKIKGLGPKSAMALLESIDSGKVAEVPDVPAIVTTQVDAPVVQASAPEKKKRVRKTKAQREAAKAAKAAAEEPVSNGTSVHNEGSASAPTEVLMDDEEVDFRSPPQIVVEEVADLSALPDDGEEDALPEGWERCMLDGKMQVIHTACGTSPCLCSLAADTAEEEDAAEEDEPAEASAEPGRSESPRGDVVSNEAPDDPVFEALKKCERLVNVIPVMQEHGIKDAQELYDKCVALKDHVPCLAKISANFDERIKRAISVRVQ